MNTKDIKNYIKSRPSAVVPSAFVTSDLTLASHRSLADFSFQTVSNIDDLDNPETKGIFNVTPDTPITRPTKGSGWSYGYILNLAKEVGLQVWFNYSGFIAVRGKGSPDSPWSEWSVMQKMT